MQVGLCFIFSSDPSLDVAFMEEMQLLPFIKCLLYGHNNDSYSMLFKMTN